MVMNGPGRKPKRLFFVSTQKAPRWGYGSMPKHTYTNEGHMRNAVQRCRNAGGEATVFVADLDWKEMEV